MPKSVDLAVRGGDRWNQVGRNALFPRFTSLAHLFGREVELEAPNTLRNLSELAATKTILESFKKAINALTVREKGDAEIRDYIKLRETRPFVVKLVSGEIWLVETKGREDLNDPGKWDRLQQWCVDASRLDSGQQYRALFVREEDWERYKPKSFHDAMAVYEKGKY